MKLDISKKEQLSFFIRHVDPVSSNIVERFLNFISAPNLTAEHLTQYIVDIPSLYIQYQSLFNGFTGV